jgi:hypothetical protein
MIYGVTGLTYPDGSIRPLPALPDHLIGKAWAVVVREPIDDLVDHLAHSGDPLVARWAQGFRDGDRV